MTQGRVFLEGEADRYHQRNAAANAAYDITTDRVAQMIDRHLRPTSIIDLGCASGERLSAICDHYKITGGNGCGIDASRKAIDVALERDENLHFVCMDWTSRHFVDESYDLVITSFAWHWIDRHSLFDALTMAHKLGEYIIINDFCSFKDVPYRHLAGIVTAKRNYPAMFLATGLYDLVDAEDYDYPGTTGREDPCSCALLKRVET